MLIHIRKLSRAHLNLVILCVAVLGYLFLTLPAFFSSHHVLKNLEPYPDGLYYALGGRNAATGEGFALTYKDARLPLAIPLLYPFFLSLGYWLFSTPTTFYLMNLLLGVGTIFLIWRSIGRLSNQPLVVFFGMGLFLTNAVLFFLPSLAMTENLSLFFFTLALYGLLSKKLQRADLLCAVGGTIGLFLTHHASISIVAVLAGWLVYSAFNLTKHLKHHKLAIWGGVGLVIVSAVLFGGSFFDRFLSVLDEMGSNQSVFFNFKYVAANIQEYLKISVGFPGAFLWLRTSLISPVVALLAIAAVIDSLRTQKNMQRVFLLSTLFLSQFPPLLVFYVVDERYSLYTMLTAVLLSVLFFAEYAQKIAKKKILGAALIAGAVLINILSQQTLFRQIISSNLLNASHAWQYEAIKSFDQFFAGQKGETQPALLITALPPVLVDAYQTTDYQVLPLSPSQEFMQKKEPMWGTDVPYDDLMTGYEQWLSEGKKLYISNAYITHQQSVIADFEAYREKFRLTKVHSDCMDACALYQVNLR